MQYTSCLPRDYKGVDEDGAGDVDEDDDDDDHAGGRVESTGGDSGSGSTLRSPPAVAC